MPEAAPSRTDSSAPTAPLSTREQAEEIVRLMQPSFWIPSPQAAQWSPLIQRLLAAFLEEFEPSLLGKLWAQQRDLPKETPPALRAVKLASESTAFHKLCQIFARSDFIPEESRKQLVPLESLPGSAIPQAAMVRARHLARESLGIDRDCFLEKIGRGSVADVFRLSEERLPRAIAIKALRVDSAPRVRAEAKILAKLADQSAQIGPLVGPQFARALAEALRDAARALLREIDFPSERRNLVEARNFYRENQRVIIPKVVGPLSPEALFMEFIEAIPLLENTLPAKTRAEVARLLLRILILEPLFSGLDETLFHADPHAGNLRLSAGPTGKWSVVLLDWSQAGRLSALMRHALIELCLDLFQGKAPSGELLGRILGAPYPGTWKGPLRGDNPLEKAMALLEQLAIEGREVPLDLLLFRKSLLTLDGILKQLDPRFDLWQQTLRYAGWVLASETPFRLLSFPIPWLDTPRFYRSGIPTRWMLTKGAKEFVRLHNFGLTASPFLCEFAPAQAVLKRSRQQKEPKVFGEHP